MQGSAQRPVSRAPDLLGGEAWFTRSRLPPRWPLEPPALVLVGKSRSVRTLLRAIGVLAPLGAHMLIRGEPGTGRRACAMLLHHKGPRRTQPFRAVSLRGLADAAIAERLFGTRGLASLKAQARNATIYIEAIDRIPLDLQDRLLGTLADGTEPGIRLLGGSAVALEEHVQLGRFRRTLFDRLATVQLSVPPLRERLEDIAPIANHVLERWSERHGKRPRRLAGAARAVLEGYAWVGNVTELVRMLETACAQTRSLAISANRVQVVLGRRSRRNAAVDIAPLRDVECSHIRHAVARCGGNRSLAAMWLGISRATLARRLRDCDHKHRAA